MFLSIISVISSSHPPMHMHTHTHTHMPMLSNMIILLLSETTKTSYETACIGLPHVAAWHPNLYIRVSKAKNTTKQNAVYCNPMTLVYLDLLAITN